MRITTTKLTIIAAALLLSTTVHAAGTAINETGEMPDASAILDARSTTKGFLPPRMTESQRTAIATTPSAAGLQVYQTDGTAPGVYLYDGSAWSALRQQVYGDVKTGLQTADHSGWIKLDGRLKSGLTASQQTQATTLGFGTNIPNAANSFLVQNGSTLGSVSGSNTKTIAQNQLPNVTLGGSTSTDGAHTHTTGFDSYSPYNLLWTTAAGGIAGYTVAGNPATSSAGNHNHTITTASINGGVSQQSIDATPKSLSVNTFVYLGN